MANSQIFFFFKLCPVNIWIYLWGFDQTIFFLPFCVHVSSSSGLNWKLFHQLKNNGPTDTGHGQHRLPAEPLAPHLQKSRSYTFSAFVESRALLCLQSSRESHFTSGSTQNAQIPAVDLHVWIFDRLPECVCVAGVSLRMCLCGSCVCAWAISDVSCHIPVGLGP